MEQHRQTFPKSRSREGPGRRDAALAGRKLRNVRERLGLRYRDVVEASKRIAAAHGNADFTVGLSRLAAIENNGVLPSIYRLYSLCTIYRMDIRTVLGWYGVDTDLMPARSTEMKLANTHLLRFEPDTIEATPEEVLPGETLSRDTMLLSGPVLQWGTLPLAAARASATGRCQYGAIGIDDWSMFPLLRPGALLVIQPSRRIAQNGWHTEYDRPIYFFERRDGCACGWASLIGERLVLEAHPASLRPPKIYRYPDEIELVGRVVGAAMPIGGSRSAERPSPA